MLEKFKTPNGFDIVIDGRFVSHFEREHPWVRIEVELNYLIERVNDIIILRERVRELNTRKTK